MLRLDINILWTIINLLIIYVIVRRFLFKPVKKVLAARQAEIDKQYEDARNTQDAAEAMKKQYEESLSGIANEKADILKEARSKASDEYERIIADAKEQAVKIESDALKNASIEKEKYMQQTREEIADLVIEATAKIAASKQNEEADRRLYDQFIAKTGENCD